MLKFIIYRKILLVKLVIVGAGIFLIIVAIIAYNIPFNVTIADTDLAATIPQLVAICNSGIGQFGQAFVPQLVKMCSEYNMSLNGIYGSGILGIILIIVGIVVTSKLKKEKTTCSYCNFVAMSETELEKHNLENHLDKSPYKCEHCDFVGITEEILWNHYNDKHPDSKKW